MMALVYGCVQPAKMGADPQRALDASPSWVVRKVALTASIPIVMQNVPCGSFERRPNEALIRVNADPAPSTERV